MNIFQTPLPLLIVASVVLIAVTLFRRGWPQKRKWWQLALPAVVILSAFGVDFFWQTDYEKIDLLIKAGKEAVVANDIERIETIISPDYRDSFHDSKARIMGFCSGMLSRPLAEKIKERYSQTEISNGRACTELEVVVHLQEASTYAAAGKIVFVKLKLYSSKTAGQRWLIDSSEILTINNQPWGWKKR